MIDLTPADAAGRVWAADMVTRHHYLHAAPDPRSRPECHLVTLGGERVGCLWWGRPEATKRFRSGLTYGPAEAVAAGRARFDRWAVLDLSRVWLAPEVQAGGRLCRPGVVPGFTDRRGVFRSALASEAIRLGLARVGADYLLARPPVYVDQPYAIAVVLSYCDPAAGHRGTIYAAAGFAREAALTPGGPDTWWTAAVAPLTADQDAAVRDAAARSPRSRRIRERGRSLFT